LATATQVNRSPVAGGRGISLDKRGAPTAPKYRNAENLQETWAGGGLEPRWPSAALKAGHKIEEVFIGGAPKSTTTKTPKARRRRKVVARQSGHRLAESGYPLAS